MVSQQNKSIYCPIVLHQILDCTSGAFEDIARVHFAEMLAGDVAVHSMQAAADAGNHVGSGGAVLTFDDGHLSDHDIALPMLVAAGASATFFIVPSFVGRDGFMQWDHIRALHKAGMEIGSHSTTHPDFRTLDDAAARDEFTRSKAVIEAEIDAEITSFAFPFGFAPPHHYQLARAAGYQYVMGSHHGRIDGHRDRILPRNSIHGGMDQAQIARTMQPDAELLVRWWLEDRVKATLKTLLPEQVYHRIRGAIARTGPQQ